MSESGQIEHVNDVSSNTNSNGDFKNAAGVTVSSRVDWSLATFFTAVFFVIPALQMVGEDLGEFAAGQRDLCYFNERCQYPRPVGPRNWQIWAFNNVVSNLGKQLDMLESSPSFLTDNQFRLRCGRVGVDCTLRLDSV